MLNMGTSRDCVFQETEETLLAVKPKTRVMSWLTPIMPQRVRVMAMLIQNLRTMQIIKLKLGCIEVGIDMTSVKKMHQKQIENLLKQSPAQRYEYFVRHCADFEQVWGLAVGYDNWIIFKDNDGDEIFPLWPHPELAEKCCFEEHKQMGAKPQAIGLESFIKNCIPDVVSNGVIFGIFYDQLRVGLSVHGEKLKADLEAEINTVWE